MATSFFAICFVLISLVPRRSQFFDADGDLAHEFYEQVWLADGRTTMRRVTQGLRQQGLVALEPPRLHPDCPCVLLMM